MTCSLVRSLPSGLALSALLSLSAAGCAVESTEAGTAETQAELTLKAPPSRTLPHTACASVGAAVVVSTSGPVTIAKDTITGGTTSFYGSCSGADNSLSKVYAFTAHQTGTVHLALTGVSPEADLALYARSSCAAESSELACSETGGWGKGESISFPVVAGTTYYANVDGIQRSSGPGTFTLTATLSPPPPVAGLSSTCSVAPTLLDAGHEIDFAGNTTGSGADLSIPSQLGSCATAGNATAGEEQILAITVSATGTLHVKSAPSAGSSYDGVIYVETSCGAAATALACANDTSGAPESLSVQVTAGTTYYLGFDTVGGWSGAFTGSATLSVP